MQRRELCAPPRTHTHTHAYTHTHTRVHTHTHTCVHTHTHAYTHSLRPGVKKSELYSILTNIEWYHHHLSGTSARRPDSGALRSQWPPFDGLLQIHKGTRAGRGREPGRSARRRTGVPGMLLNILTAQHIRLISLFSFRGGEKN